MLLLYRKNKLRDMKKEEEADEIKQSSMGKEKEMDKIKQSSMGNRERVKAFKHGGIVKEKGLWRGVTGVKN